MYVSSLPENAEYDYVVVGSGSAGCVVANRLTAAGRHSVRSIGTAHIQSPDPLQQATMDPKYFFHEADAQLFLDGLRVARRVAQMPALKPFIVRETRPGPEVLDDAGLLDYMRNTIQTAWHMVGTCKMGIDSSAVVDPQLRVCGVANLRVIDSSICPTIPSSNTNIAAIAIGEKGADLLLAAAHA
ncbi:MAG: hypothetical protein HYU44_19140 [Betaproteobacteria bacterium]|nr:hypothetical protein [Betaproteobacteria bacterium]MBI3057223.1 hypothetical protein [Betaproteobacteria bacterium]